MLSTNENHVTYSEVTEVLSDGSHTVYTYTNHETVDYRDEPRRESYSSIDNERWRYDPFISRELERGNLLTMTMYASDGSRRQEEQYTYNSDPNRFNTFIRAVSVKEQVLYEGSSHPRGSVFDTRITAYVHYNYIPYRTSRIVRTYDPTDEAKFVETAYDYQYGNPEHHQVTQVTHTDSEEKERKTTYTYAPDFPNDEYNSNALVARHIYTPALLQVDEVGNLKTFQQERYYGQSSTNAEHVVLDRTSTYPVGSGTDPIRIFYQYNASGNITEVRKENDLPASFVWGYNQEYPIAEVVDAFSNQVSYTGFEEDTDNISTDAHTGKQSHQGTYTVELPSAGGSYIVSYWQKSGSTWDFQTQTISSDTPIGGASLLINDVRVHPAGALMKHLTYDPVYGQTSSYSP